MIHLFKLRFLLQQNLYFRKLRFRLKGIDPNDYIVQKNKTRICIEGYPRSANSFAYRMFSKVNDGHIAHHVHSVGNVKRAVEYGIPTVVLIRKPVDAIMSFVVGIAGDSRDYSQKVEYAILYYILFYQRISSYRDSVVIADFQTVIKDINIVIDQVNLKYGATFNNIEDPNGTAKTIKNELRNAFSDEGKKQPVRRPILGRFSPEFLRPMVVKNNADLRWMPIPNQRREEIKKRVKPLVTDHPMLQNAQIIYKDLNQKLA